MKNKRLIILSIVIALVLIWACTGLYAASAASADSDEEQAVVLPEQDLVNDIVLSGITADEPDSALYADAVIPDGVLYANETITIKAAGTYRLAGDFTGNVVVDADGPVELILAGVSITSSTAGKCAIEIVSNEDVLLTLEEGTENTLADGASSASSSASAALYSKGALTIAGSGSLTVTAGANNGIQCKSDLTITGGQLTVTAANHGLKARGALTVSGGNITIQCGGDGLCGQDGRITSGDIIVAGGSIVITAGERGLDAEGDIIVTGGSLNILSAEDGIRGINISVVGGTVTIDTDGDGIQAEALLSIDGGKIQLTAGERGMDADGDITVTGGNLSILSANDGIRGTNVSITDGVIAIDAGCDGIQAETLLSIAGGEFQIVTGGGGGDASSHAGESFNMGGSFNRSDTESDSSAKGLKSNGDIIISDGTFELNNSDDSIHCAVLCTIDGGTFTICSSDDAIHSDDMLVINNGTISITDCFEGLEAYAVEVHGGEIDIRSVNDGINANGPETMFMNRQNSASGETEEDSSSDSVSGASVTYYRQTGGSVNVVITGNSSNVGDGVDSNGSVYIDGGILTVSTDGSTQEGAIDYGNGEFVITGGIIIAGGSSMMQENISSSSTQCCAILSMNTQNAGTEVSIMDSDGNVIISFVLEDRFSCLVLTHPDMTVGNIYTVTYGTESSTLDFTSSNVINAASGFGMGGMGPGMGSMGGGNMGGPGF